MNLIKTADILEWIKAQPDEREVHMGQISGIRCPGCVMVQYARSIGIKEGDIICGTNTLNRNQSIKMEPSWGPLISALLDSYACDEDVTTFKRVKEIISQVENY